MRHQSSSGLLRKSGTRAPAKMHKVAAVANRPYICPSSPHRFASLRTFSRRRVLQCIAYAAATSPGAISLPASNYASLLNRKTNLAPLPPPPKTSTLLTVLPFLCRLALEEKALLWRFGLSFACMVISKSAGENRLLREVARCSVVQSVQTLQHAICLL